MHRENREIVGNSRNYSGMIFAGIGKKKSGKRNLPSVFASELKLSPVFYKCFHCHLM